MSPEKPAAILAEARATRSPLRGLYAITDSQLMVGEMLLAKSEAALRGGCRLLQYRDKQAAPERQLQQARQLRALCDRYGACLVINDNVELALAVGADGLHIGQTDAPLLQVLARVREQAGERMRVGISCHGDLALAQQAEADGADYVAFGRFFPSRTKPAAPPADPVVLQQARTCLSLPLVAIGGITRDNAPRLIDLGADMVAVIHELFAPDDLDEIEQRARDFTHLFS